MAKKRKSKAKNFLKNTFSFIGQFFALTGKGLLKATPVFILLLVFYGVTLGIKSYLYADSNLIVSNIRLITDGDYSRDLVLKKAAIPKGENILNVDVRKIARALEVDPKIKKALVRKDFPQTLFIDLKIRKPMAFLLLPNKKPFYQIDSDGFVMRSIKALPKNPDLLIIDESNPPRRMKVKSTYTSEGLEEVNLILATLKEENYFDINQLTQIKVDRLKNLSLLVAGVEVKLGTIPVSSNLKRIPQAFKILKEEKIDIRDTQYIDLRFEDIIIKKK